MASLIDDRKKGTGWRVAFKTLGGRKAIRLGKLTPKTAKVICTHISELESDAVYGSPIAPATRHWMEDIRGTPLFGKLAKHNLIDPGEAWTLEDWLAKYEKDHTSELKPSSLKKIKSTSTKLLASIASDTPIHRITLADAGQWWADMKASGLSLATMKIHAGNAKTIFRKAEQFNAIESNPFAELKSGNTPTQNRRYVTPEETTAVLSACPTVAWKVVVGLARYAGLRMPSEGHPLTWADVDWEKRRLFIRSPKTEHHQGHESRVIPIDSRLMAILNEAYEFANANAEHPAELRDKYVMTLRADRNHRARLPVIVKKAGVKKWDDIFQTLRRSCEIEWAQYHPQYAVSKWAGHSMAISDRHYANVVPDEVYDAASTKIYDAHLCAPDAGNTLQNDATNITQPPEGETVCAQFASDCENLQEPAKPALTDKKWSRGESNPRKWFCKAA